MKHTALAQDLLSRLVNYISCIVHQQWRVALFALMLCFIVSACGPGNEPQFGEVKQLAEYLYEVTYDDLDDRFYDVDVQNILDAACSSVRYGNLHARNFDFYYSNGVEVVAHVKASDNRFASVALCGDDPTITPKQMKHAGRRLINWLPFISIDGVNENGVAININVVPALDCPTPTGTNPGARRLHILFVPRYVLDHARSAEHAVQLLQDLDIFGSFGNTYGFHFMISDPQQTYIVEFLGNTVKYSKDGPVSTHNVMTNFYNTLPELTDHAEGIERHRILVDHYSEGSTEQGMLNLMKSVRFSLAYDTTNTPFWFSEYYGLYPDGSDTVDVNMHTDTTWLWPLLLPDVKQFEQRERNAYFWHTAHTSIFNLDTRELLLFVQEDYEHSWRFALQSSN